MHEGEGPTSNVSIPGLTDLYIRFIYRVKDLLLQVFFKRALLFSNTFYRLFTRCTQDINPED